MAYPRNVHDRPILYYSSDTVKYKGVSLNPFFVKMKLDKINKICLPEDQS